MKKKLIVFKLEYLHTKGWGAISNFITKFSEKIEMEPSDVEIVSSVVLEKELSDKNFILVKEVDHKRELFKKIAKPGNIYAVNEKYDYLFFISVDFKQLFDVVDLQNIYLIGDACRQFKILTLISGTQGEYHKTSQFFAFLTERKQVTYENVFFKSDVVKHLQISGIGVLSKFLPLVPVDAFEDMRMRRRVEEFISIEIIDELLKGEKMEKEVPRILAGAARKLSKNYEKLQECDKEQCVVFLSELNILSFLLFCFSLEGRTNPFSDFGEFSEALQKIVFWANGCIQLIENIVFHSNHKRGIFSFRVLDGKTAYVRNKYSMDDPNEKWIEMMIVDYAGCNQALNMAEKFQDNLSDLDLRADFADLKPRDFFIENTSEKISLAWKRYYSEKKNVINHYGLKIFQKVVQDSKGYFVAQSFSSHWPQQDEIYDNVSGTSLDMQKMCIPGTSYSILFPIEQENIKEKFDDYGIENFEHKIDVEDTLFDYERINKTIPIIKKAVSPQEKIKLINQIADDLLGKKRVQKSIGSKMNGLIISVNASELRGDAAEIVYKAIALTLLQCEYKCHIVMYECQQEFVRMFLDVAYLGCINFREEISYQGGRQIVLYTAEYYEEIIILPEDWESTCLINRSNNFSRETRWKNFFEKWEYQSQRGYAGEKVKRYPFDILTGEGQEDTVFEKYVKTVIKRNIQGQELGCKIEDTHMRLGSTIHVNYFYEAEILFANFLFVERFALLMIKSMLDSSKENFQPLKASDKITLYGYTNYSEQTVFCTMQFLKKALPGIDVDYAILERESEDRGFTHVDRIRYSTYFEDGENGIKKRKSHFQSRKIICIIPIASTLKTNEKMINLFLEENGGVSYSVFWRNFELILVGSKKENKYWKKEGKYIIGRDGMEIQPMPEFFVEVKLDYMEPLECTMCFPAHMIDEKPLIEVNAASTIPNQAFGLIGEKRENSIITMEKLQSEEEKLEVLKKFFLYRHLERNENHFLFYFQTERLIVKYSKEVCDWLKKLRDQIEIRANDYIVLFCPAHFSNAGFIEYVNSCVFGSAAVIIRDDVDKEYRCNFKAKFSNLRNFVKKMMCYKGNAGYERRIRLFYVDDAIITGRTFYRAKSLAQSIMEDYGSIDSRQKYVVFEGIFVLIDRNSNSSRWQYTGVKEEEHLYAFRTIHISSIRNHGDACVYCNLAKEAETLKKSSVTKYMKEYWETEEEKFSVKPLGIYLKDRAEIEKKEKPRSTREERDDRAFRRLVCTNNAMIFLDEKYHGNRKKEVLEQLLMLILKGSELHKGKEAEYFLSYCKVISRPFRVFDKAVKEAVFDFLLLVSISTLFEKSYDDIIVSSEKKPYLKEMEIKQGFSEIEVFVKKFFPSQSQRQSLLKVLLKQLTEMKSNFIMRESVMRRVLDYADMLGEKDGEGFLRYYKYLLKKLTGISSDTSKSLWLDRMLYNNWDNNKIEIQRDIYLENVWIYQDAFQKLNARVKLNPDRWDTLLNFSEGKDFEKYLIKFEQREIKEYLKPYQFKDFLGLLQQYKMCDGINKLNEKGEIFVAANFLLHRFITADFESGLRAGIIDKGNLTKVDYIATCMKYIMDAKEVVVIMEFEAEYDLWENIIIDRYNALLSEQLRPERIACESQKEYIILGNSEGKKSRWTVREKPVITKIQRFRKESHWAEKGYAYDTMDDIFWWELGHTTEYPVYVFATWGDSEQDKVLMIDRLNRIRAVMQYYWQLNNSVFNKKNEGFFCEIAQQRKKNAIQSRQKAHNHTKSDIKLEQYDHMLQAQKYSKYYQSDLLMFLADLNVSEHYRNSLMPEYYLKGNLLRAKKWGASNSPFANRIEFDVINSDAAMTTKLIVSNEVIFKGDSPLDSEKIEAFDTTNGERDSYLLIYSLMLNAVVNNRGKVENGCVTVYCSRTPEGNLRIANRIGENPGNKSPQQIMEELRYPPEEEQQGISLWSMSRYIKGMTASILDRDLRKLEKAEMPVTEEKLKKMRCQILRFLGREFELVVEKQQIGTETYFSVSVPILACKYEE